MVENKEISEGKRASSQSTLARLASRRASSRWKREEIKITGNGETQRKGTPRATTKAGNDSAGKKPNGPPRKRALQHGHTKLAGAETPFSYLGAGL
jgi:hypothetical protein